MIFFPFLAQSISATKMFRGNLTKMPITNGEPHSSYGARFQKTPISLSLAGSLYFFKQLI